MYNQEHSADVLIIGAGAAGLAAARELSHAGLKTIVIEARDRIGGRIFTKHGEATVPIELGAEFVHGKPEDTWNIIDEAHLTACETSGERWTFGDGKLQQRDFWPAIEKITNQMKARKDGDMSLHSFLKECCTGEDWKESRVFAESFFQGFDAADPELVSIYGLVRADESSDEIEMDKAFRLVDGYDSLINWFQADAEQGTKIYMNSRVTEVHWRRDNVHIHAKGSSPNAVTRFDAPRAIITLPLGVLKAQADQPGAVRFEPPLEEKQDALSKLEMGDVLKIVMTFKERFWEQVKAQSNGEEKDLSELSFLHSPGSSIPTWWTLQPIKSPVLIGWAGGPVAERMLNRGEDYIIEAGLSVLSRALGIDQSHIRGLLEKWHFHDWKSDPFSRGAYSYIAVGGVDAPEILSRPIENTLFFAGEATATDGQNGTVDSAIKSGKRAAAEILNVAQTASLRSSDRDNIH